MPGVNQLGAQTPPQLSWQELQVQMRACRLCVQAGYDVFPRAIFSGAPGAQVMIIGQAPGVTEKEAGRPFNAGSGSRLFRWLAEAGVDEGWFRSTQYMTSVTKCYPGRSPSGGGDRVPSRQEQRLCRPYLEAEIALINPALIIPVGRLAISLFYPPGFTLEEVIGAEKQVGDSWVAPLPHPSGASRWHQSEDNRRRVKQALGAIRARLEQLNLV